MLLGFWSRVWRMGWSVTNSNESCEGQSVVSVRVHVPLIASREIGA
jgi:hypothetical protein